MMLFRMACWFVLSCVWTQAQTYPDKDWLAGRPEDAGFSSKRLKSLTPFLESLDTSAMVVISGGRVVYSYGDVQKVSYLASCRKSVLAMLYGNYVASGKIRLSTTLVEMGFDDVGGLLPREKEATVEHLITARSGVYHAASNAGDDTASAPPRASQKPGTYFLYNNWDFNAAGAAFEKLTGKDVFDALQTDLAEPIGMQDFERARHVKNGDKTRSNHMAYHMHFSTRDMARLGYLMLNEGKWRERQLVPRDWAKRIVSLVTPMDDMNPPSVKGYARGGLWGYGYMWWVWEDHKREGPFAGAYSAFGAFGQYITVLPSLGAVVAHKTVPAADGERPRGVSGGDYQAILAHVAASYCGRRCSE